MHSFLQSVYRKDAVKMSVLILIVSFMLCVLYYLNLRFSYEGRLMAKLPGIKAYPIFEHLFSFILPPDKLFAMLREVYKLHNRISKMQTMGIRYVNIYHPDDVETILSSPRFNEKEVPYTFLQPWLGQGLLISNGEKWRQRRKLLTPAFHFDILKQFSRVFIEQTDRFLQKVGEEAKKEKTDLVPLIAQATLSVMCETSMGTSVQDKPTILNEYFASVNLLSRCLVYRMVRVWTYFEWLFKLSPTGWKQRQALQVAHEFTNNVISDRRKEIQAWNNKENYAHILNESDSLKKRRRLAMLDLLLENEKQGAINGEGIREEVDTFMFEGHDTTASALCFAIMRIANEPVIQELIYKEMQSIFGESQRSPSLDDLAEMNYLECCIKESLRLYPSVPMISRFLQEEVTLSGYRVPPGTKIVIQVFDIHRQKDIYPDPESFIPERFNAENCAKRHRYAYIPFSAGPRNCIGQKFAMLEMKTLLSGLLRRFRLEPITTPQELVFTVDLTLKTNHPIYVRFSERS